MCASYGSVNSIEAIHFAQKLSEKFSSEIIPIYVKPSSYYEGIEYVPTDESDIYQNWIDENSKEKIKNLCEIAGKVEVRQGTPFEEILSFARENKADLIAINSSVNISNNHSISRTIIKLIRQSEIPVLTVHPVNKRNEINNILVPTGLFDIDSNDFRYAVELSNTIESKVFHLHVLETADINYPVEVVEELRGDAYARIAENDQKYKNVITKVTEAKNVWNGISEFAENNQVDLVVLNTYVGKKGKRHDFIGTVCEKVIQTLKLPVITIRP